jgi:hypothetical protein
MENSFAKCGVQLLGAGGRSILPELAGVKMQNLAYMKGREDSLVVARPERYPSVTTQILAAAASL